MSALLFLGIALGLSLVGVLVLWMRNRPPKSVDAHIRAFSRELDALAPDSQATSSRTRPDGPDGAVKRPLPIAPQPIEPQPMRPIQPMKSQPKRGRRSG